MGNVGNAHLLRLPVSSLGLPFLTGVEIVPCGGMIVWGVKKAHPWIEPMGIEPMKKALPEDLRHEPND